MVSKRRTLASRSVSRRSSHNGERRTSSSPPRDVPHTAEAVPAVPMEEYMQYMKETQNDMKETQNEMLQLLREALLPINARGAFQRQNTLAEAPLMPPVRSEVHRQEEELLDIAGSTHPPPADDLNQGVPSLPEDAIPPREFREEMRRLLSEEFPAIGRNLFVTRRGSHEISPFAKEVQQYPIPTGFKLPNIELYDGTSDPYEHVDHFRTIMRIQKASDSLLCQVFPTTLKGQARTWFYSLPDGNISTFGEFVDIFTEQFMANRRIIKDSSHLSGIRQKEEETLKEYFQRFTTEARQIPGVDPELLRGVFLGGLRPGPFYSSLMRDTVRSYADLVHRVEAQIAADEAINTHKQQFVQLGEKRKNNTEYTSQHLQKKKFNRNHDSTPPPANQHHDSHREKKYTPLNTSRANILMAIEGKETLKWPKPLRNPDGGNQSQYCHFHRAKGHSTENCFHLKEEIERMIRQGNLGLYLQSQGEPNRQKMVGTIE